jgi:biopolymer transport protein TolQ
MITWTLISLPVKRTLGFALILGGLTIKLAPEPHLGAPQDENSSPVTVLEPSPFFDSFPTLALETQAFAAPPVGAPTQPGTPPPGVTPAEESSPVEFESQGIFSRALQGGIIVFSCLMVLIILSVLSWAIAIAKWVYLGRLGKTSEGFIKSFWDSRSLNDLNTRLGEYPYSPVREVFRIGYGELVRSSQIREQAQSTQIAVNAALENLQRALQKGKLTERRKLEKFLSLLSITASVSPFIGLFGTVWGIMNAFEGIARSGSASLAAVAPGISEALIATAFGLAAAIPAVVGYNIFVGKIRQLMSQIDGFGADFLNIVQRYLVTDRPKNPSGPGVSPQGGGHSGL